MPKQGKDVTRYRHAKARCTWDVMRILYAGSRCAPPTTQRRKVEREQKAMKDDHFSCDSAFTAARSNPLRRA